MFWEYFMKPIFIWCLLLSLPLLFSCQSSSDPLDYSQVKVNSLYIDHQFTKPDLFEVESEQEIFMLDEEMIALVDTKLKSSYSPKKKAKILLDHIFSQDNIALSYTSNANVTAREAFHSQTANCMSLTIMAYALAHEAGLNVSFQQVDVPEYWVRNGQYNMLTGHVNLVIKEHPSVERDIIWGDTSTEIDFDPFVAKENFPKKVIDKNTVLAMFYNNKGANALIKQNYAVAYQYFRAAIKQDESFSPAWGNLGVLYKYTEHYPQAEKVYRHALMLNKSNLTALTNLALLLKDQNRDSEAQGIDNYLHQMRKLNPYYYSLLADEAFHQTAYKEAEKNYIKAIELDNKRHEFYFGLAKVYYKQNKIIAAKRSMKRAIRLNKTRSTNKQYIAKLNFLKQPEPALID